jgi:hypothetical protein
MTGEYSKSKVICQDISEENTGLQQVNNGAPGPPDVVSLLPRQSWRERKDPPFGLRMSKTSTCDPGARNIVRGARTVLHLQESHRTIGCSPWFIGTGLLCSSTLGERKRPVFLHAAGVGPAARTFFSSP